MAFFYFLLVIVGVLILISTISSKGFFFIKSALFAILFATGSSIPLLYFPFRPFDPRNNILCYKYGRFFLKLASGVEYKIRGSENVKDYGGVVLINHQSLFDMLTIAWLTPIFKTIRTISKKEVKYQIPIGLSIWSTGAIFIDRTNLESTKKSLNEGAKLIHTKNAKIFFYPEGTRHSSEKLLPFKKGAFHVAIDNQCSIQPVVTSKYFFFDWDKRYFNKGVVLVTIFPEISTEGLTTNDIPQLMDKVYNLMNDEFQKLNMEALELNSKLIS